MGVASASDELSSRDRRDVPRRLGFVRALDGVRGVAVLVVVVHHVPALVPAFQSNRPRGGYLGVDIFFVLSGFLITALLLREQLDSGGVRLGAFYARRALRLLPALVVLLVVHELYLLATGVPARGPFAQSISILFYFQNLGPNFKGATPAFVPLWSLAVEEQFYLLWPLVLMLFLGIRHRTWVVVTIMIAAIAAVDIHRAVAYDHTSGIGLIRLYTRTDYRADSLLVGALLAQLWVRGKTPTRGLRTAAWIALAFVATCIARVHVTDAFLYRGGYTVIAVAIAVVLLAVLESTWVGVRALCLAPLRAIGRVSYGLYLWHIPVFLAVYRYGSHLDSTTRLVLGLGIAGAITYASWVLVERPILRWKRRNIEPAGVPEAELPRI
jgi:peptidoglycan/LPS O-acetylase OafA/YrhL